MFLLSSKFGFCISTDTPHFVFKLIMQSYIPSIPALPLAYIPQPPFSLHRVFYTHTIPPAAPSLASSILIPSPSPLTASLFSSWHHDPLPIHMPAPPPVHSSTRFSRMSTRLSGSVRAWGRTSERQRCPQLLAESDVTTV